MNSSRAAGPLWRLGCGPWALITLTLLGGCGDPEPASTPPSPQDMAGPADAAPDASLRPPELPTLPDPTRPDASPDLREAPDHPPRWPEGAMLIASPLGPTSARVTWTPAQDDGQVVAYEVLVEGGPVARVPARQLHAQLSGLDPDELVTIQVWALDDRAQRSATSLSTQFKANVPDPATVAPPLEGLEPAQLADALSYLYQGQDPIQRDVRAGAIAPARVAQLFGVVRTMDGQPAPGVRVHVLGHPELGYTLTRADGRFDLVVQGGEALTLHYTSPGHLPAQRRAVPAYGLAVEAAPVALLPYDPKVSRVTLSQDASPVVQGSLVSDVDGSRQPLLIFKPQTKAHMVLPDGSHQPLDTLDVRITEHTVGERGPEAMPGALPPSSAYTYAASLTVDEAEQAGAVRVEFDQPVALYVQNFLNFPVAEGVPIGYYDFELGRWVAQPNGVVIKVVGHDAEGAALIDADGDDLPEDDAALLALQLDAPERAALGQRMMAGQTLWRSLITHFTPYDCNWGVGCDTEAADCVPADVRSSRFPGQNGCAFGSIVDCDEQTLREHVPIDGTMAMLSYASHYQHGFAAKRVEHLSLAPTSLRGLRGVDVRLDVGGTSTCVRVSGSPRSPVELLWDGTLWDGRRFKGSIQGQATVTFYYPLVMRGTTFGAPPRGGPITQLTGGATVDGRAVRGFLTEPYCAGDFTTFFYSSATLPVSFENWSVDPQLLGGWTLTPHHTFDRASQTLYRGDGAKIKLSELAGEVVTVAGAGSEAVFSQDRRGDPVEANLGSIEAILTAPDNGLYLASDASRVYYLSPDRKTIRSVAGTWLFTGGGSISGGYNGDGQPAAYSLLNQPYDLAMDDQGGLFISDRGNHRIRRVSAQGDIETWAGGGTHDEDGIDARQARLHDPHGIAMGPDGSLYVALPGRACVRRIGPDGIIDTVVGVCGRSVNRLTLAPARHMLLSSPRDVKVDRFGNLYVSDMWLEVVLKVDPQGQVSVLAGTSGNGPAYQEGPATQVRLLRPTRLSLGRASGEVFISEDKRVVRVLAGFATSYLGDGTTGANRYRKKLSRRDVKLPSSNTAIALGRFGDVYFAIPQERAVRKIALDLGTLAGNRLVVPDQQAQELYYFDPQGNHAETRDLSGERLMSFEYERAGLLSALRGPSGERLLIERDAQGVATAIVSPGGQRTTLSMAQQPGQPALLEAVTYQDQTGWQMAYYQPGVDPGCDPQGSRCEGLLKELMGPRGHTHHFTYDSLGRLIRERGLEGFEQSLSSERQRGTRVSTLTDALGKQVTQRSESAEGVTTVTVREDSGLQTVTQLRAADGLVQVTSPDGVMTTTTLGPDARFGAAMPHAATVTTRRPSGLTMTTSYRQEVTLANPEDVFSWVQQTEQTTTQSGAWSATKTEIWEPPTRTWTRRSAMGYELQLRADALGRLIERSSAGRATASMSYDAAGRLTLAREGQRELRFDYDARGHLTRERVVDAMSATQLSGVAMQYDASGRVISRSVEGGATTSLSYDAAGLLTSLTSPRGHTHRLTYDQAGRLSAYEEPAVNGQVARTTFAYNARHQLERVTMQDGSTIIYGYGPSSRPQRVTGPGLDLEMTYDATTGRLISKAQRGGVSMSFTWDGDLLTSQTWTDAQGQLLGALSWTWDGLGRIIQRSVAGQPPIALSYNLDEQLVQADALTLTYDPVRGDLVGTSLGQVTTAQSINDYGELASLEATAQGVARYTLTQTQDALGRVTTRQESVEGQPTSWAFEYSPAGYLSEVRRDGAVVERLGYDAHGNLTSRQAQGVTLAATYDERDRLLTFGPRQYAHDAIGRRISVTEGAAQTTYGYDGRHTLTRVASPDGRLIEYELDPEGSRLGKRVNGALVRRWLWRDLTLLDAELDPQGQLVSRFIYGSRPHVPDTMLRQGRTYRLVHDALGSVRLVVDVDTGQVAQRLDYDVWGRVIADSQPGFQPFGFAGGQYDPDTGLVRFGLRDYDPQTARWLQPEPLGLEGGSSNFYLYALNDPVNMIDVDGEMPFLVAFLLGGALSALFDAALQYASKGCVNYAQVAIAGIIGGLGSGLSGVAGRALGTWSTRGLVADRAARISRTARAIKLKKAHWGRPMSAERLAQASSYARGLDSSIALGKALSETVANVGVSALGAGAQKMINNALGMNYNSPSQQPSGVTDGLGRAMAGAAGFGMLGPAATTGASARQWGELSSNVAGMIIERAPY